MANTSAADSVGPDSDEGLSAALLHFLVELRPADFNGGGAAGIAERLKGWRLLKLDQNSRDDELPPSIAKTFVDIAKRGANPIAAATLQLNPEQPDGISWRTKFIAAAAIQGFATALCPFSGEPRKVAHSLGRDWLYLQNGPDLCLASKMGAAMVDVALETVWLFPRDRLILRTSSYLSNDAILQETSRFLASLFANQADVLSYLTRAIPEGGDGVSISDFRCPHMSHNLWNLQTGWFNLFEKVTPDHFKTIVNFAGQNFFGSLGELYPDLMKNAPEVVSVRTDEELLVHALKTGGVMLGVKDEMFRPGFSERLLKRARSLCSPGFLTEVRELRESCKPLVVTTVRLDNREWIEQREGLPHLFSELRTDFPKLGVILDGLSSDTAKGWTTGWMSMDAELEVAKRVRAETPPDMPVVFSIGRTFAEALVLCDAADCFIAPSGSGMALYKWISNKPGLAFSNRTVLDLNNAEGWPLRVWHLERFRHDITPTNHIPVNLVKDEAAARGSRTRANFTLAWQGLYREAKDYLKGLGY